MPTVAPLPRCASGMRARCGYMNGIAAVVSACRRVPSSSNDAQLYSFGPSRSTAPPRSRSGAVWVSPSTAGKRVPADRRRSRYAPPHALRTLRAPGLAARPRRHRPRRAVGGDARRSRTRADDGARGSRSGSTTTSTPCRSPPSEATHEAWTLMAAFAAVTEPGPARPDVHLHELPQPRLPGQGRRDRRRHLRRPRRDGHRRRLVRARVARLRLRLPVGRRAARRCCDEGVQIMRAGLDRRAGHAATASTTRSTARSCRPLPLQDGGIPLWIAGGGEKVTLQDRRAVRRSTRTSTARSRASPTSPRSSRGHCDDVGTRLRRDHPLGQLQRRHRRDRGRGRGPAAAARGPDRAVRRRGAGPSAAAAGSAGCRRAARPSRSWRSCASWRPRG